MKKERKVIDAHLHIFGHCEFGDRLAHGIGDEPTQEYLTEKYYGRLGIEKGIVMGNGPLEEQGKNLGEYFYYSAGLDEKDSWLKLEEIESHLQRKRCVGVKLYPGYYELYPNDKSLYPIYKMTEEYGKVLSVHTGMVAGNGGHLKYCRPIHLDDIATDFPGLKIVMCHFGNPFLQEAAAVLEKNPNMYADLSGLIEGAFETETFIKDQSGYNKVRNYSMLKDKPENGGYFEQIFDNGIIGYFKKSLMEIYGSTVNMDVLTALEKEAKYEKNEYDATRIEQYVKKVIAETRNLSNPFIERPLGEQKAPIAACTYSKELDPKDDSPRSMLIAKELGNYGGTPDEDIPLNMIMFYQSIYGLRANKLSKFSPGCAAEGRSDGEYYKAYYEVVSQIKPKSDKTPVITPHIDRNWHIVSALPDLDEENQRRQEREIYRAFALGIICDLVCYSKISEGKYLYRLELNDLEPEEFVVSNGTPCDHYYEVLDALTINPVAVQTILSYMKEKFADERNSSGKLDFEHSYLRRQINELASIEYGKDGLSIFDVALLLKVSTPSAEFDKTVGKGIMREILTLIYEYAQTMVLEADLDRIYGKFVLEQFEMFDKNIDWYMDNWKDNFSDYINDLMRIAVSDIERKKLTDIYEEMRKIMKESSKKRG